jgi:hypothetical protein
MILYLNYTVSAQAVATGPQRLRIRGTLRVVPNRRHTNLLHFVLNHLGVGGARHHVLPRGAQRALVQIRDGLLLVNSRQV